MSLLNILLHYMAAILIYARLPRAPFIFIFLLLSFTIDMPSATFFGCCPSFIVSIMYIFVPFFHATYLLCIGAYVLNVTELFV